jgi:hypothetical protein
MNEVSESLVVIAIVLVVLVLLLDDDVDVDRRRVRCRHCSLAARQTAARRDVWFNFGDWSVRRESFASSARRLSTRCCARSTSATVRAARARHWLRRERCTIVVH